MVRRLFSSVVWDLTFCKLAILTSARKQMKRHNILLAEVDKVWNILRTGEYKSGDWWSSWTFASDGHRRPAKLNLFRAHLHI